MKVKGWGASSVPGMRRMDGQPNEDTFLALEAPGLFAAIDGMGGHRRAEAAAQKVAQAISAGYLGLALTTGKAGTLMDKSRHRLAEVAVAAASAALIEQDAERRGRMGATIALLDVPAGVIAWCGDARAYQVGDEVRHMTVDHSPWGELFEAGKIDFATYKDRSTNIVTRHVGADGVLGRAETAKIDAPGRYLLLSDGLLVLEESTIVKILASADDPKVAARALTEAALLREGLDDITAVVVDLEE